MPKGTTKNLLVAGSDVGFNMRFTIQTRYNYEERMDGWIGISDVRRITLYSRDHFQRNYSGKWRMRAYGKTTCRHSLAAGLDISWFIDNWDRPVHK